MKTTKTLGELVLAAQRQGSFPDPDYHPDMVDWIAGPVGHHRDSDLIAESNWHTALARIRAAGEEGEDWVYIRFGHFGVGWVEEMGTRPGTNCAEVAEEIRNSLADYPVLNADDLAERESERVQQNWHEICYEVKRDLKKYCRAEWTEWGDAEDDLVDDLDDYGDLETAAHGLGEQNEGWVRYSRHDVAVIADKLADKLGYQAQTVPISRCQGGKGITHHPDCPTQYDGDACCLDEYEDGGSCE